MDHCTTCHAPLDSNHDRAHAEWAADEVYIRSLQRDLYTDPTDTWEEDE